MTAEQRAARSSGMRDALAYCRRRKHLRRTLKTALIVGVILTLINQSGVLLDGAATTATYVRCGLNFVVPFVVSNVGLLSGRSSAPVPVSAADELRT